MSVIWTSLKSPPMTPESGGGGEATAEEESLLARFRALRRWISSCSVNNTRREGLFAAASVGFSGDSAAVAAAEEGFLRLEEAEI